MHAHDADRSREDPGVVGRRLDVSVGDVGPRVRRIVGQRRGHREPDAALNLTPRIFFRDSRSFCGFGEVPPAAVVGIF